MSTYIITEIHLCICNFGNWFVWTDSQGHNTIHSNSYYSIFCQAILIWGNAAFKASTNRQSLTTFKCLAALSMVTASLISTNWQIQGCKGRLHYATDFRAVFSDCKSCLAQKNWTTSQRELNIYRPVWTVFSGRHLHKFKTKDHNLLWASFFVKSVPYQPYPTWVVLHLGAPLIFSFKRRASILRTGTMDITQMCGKLLTVISFNLISAINVMWWTSCDDNS